MGKPKMTEEDVKGGRSSHLDAVKKSKFRGRMEYPRDYRKFVWLSEEDNRRWLQYKVNHPKAKFQKTVVELLKKLFDAEEKNGI